MGSREEPADARYGKVVLDRLIDASRDAIKMIDLDGRIVRWNPSAEELYGWPEAEVLGKKLPHVPEEARLRTLRDIRSVAASGRPVQREAVGLRSDGARLTLNLSVIPTADDLGNATGVLSVVRHSLSGGAPKDHEDLACALSQELRSPLTAVLGYAQLLARPEIAGDAARRARTVRSLEECGARLSEVLDELVVLSQAREGRLAIDPEPIEVASLVTDVVGRVEAACPGARFVIDFDSSVPRLRLDRRRMDQALSILMSEAVATCSLDSAILVSILPEGDATVAIEVCASSYASPAGDETRPFDETIRLRAAAAVVGVHGGTLAVDREPTLTRVSLRLPVQ